jgi:hypothetical protein
VPSLPHPPPQPPNLESAATLREGPASWPTIALIALGTWRYRGGFLNTSMAALRGDSQATPPPTYLAFSRAENSTPLPCPPALSATRGQRQRVPLHSHQPLLPVRFYHVNVEAVSLLGRSILSPGPSRLCAAASSILNVSMEASPWLG